MFDKKSPKKGHFRPFLAKNGLFLAFFKYFPKKMLG